MRAAAARALTEVAGRRSERAFAEVSKQLDHPNPDVRCLALEVLVEVSSRGDERTIAAVGKRLQDRHVEVRLAAVTALQKADIID